MTELAWPDQHHANATVGWVMLGNPTEARVEFEKLSAPSRREPQVLGLEWRLLAQERRWEQAFAVAEAQFAATPNDPEPWIHRSYALHELRRTREAFDLLLPAAARFPTETTIPYNLACYLTQLGDLPGARKWIAKVFVTGKSPVEILQHLRAALQDPDLQPLWPEISRQLDELPSTTDAPP